MLRAELGQDLVHEPARPMQGMAKRCGKPGRKPIKERDLLWSVSATNKSESVALTVPGKDASPAALAGFHLTECLLVYLVKQKVLHLHDASTVLGNALFAMAESAKRHPERDDPIDAATDMLMGTLRVLTRLDPASVAGQAT